MSRTTQMFSVLNGTDAWTQAGRSASRLGRPMMDAEFRQNWSRSLMGMAMLDEIAPGSNDPRLRAVRERFIEVANVLKKSYGVDGLKLARKVAAQTYADPRRALAARGQSLEALEGIVERARVGALSRITKPRSAGRQRRMGLRGLGLDTTTAWAGPAPTMTATATAPTAPTIAPLTYEQALYNPQPTAPVTDPSYWTRRTVTLQPNPTFPTLPKMSFGIPSPVDAKVIEQARAACLARSGRWDKGACWHNVANMGVMSLLREPLNYDTLKKYCVNSLFGGVTRRLVETPSSDQSLLATCYEYDPAVGIELQLAPDYLDQQMACSTPSFPGLPGKFSSRTGFGLRVGACANYNWLTGNYETPAPNLETFKQWCSNKGGTLETYFDATTRLLEARCNGALAVPYKQYYPYYITPGASLVMSTTLEQRTTAPCPFTFCNDSGTPKICCDSFANAKRLADLWGPVIRNANAAPADRLAAAKALFLKIERAGHLSFFDTVLTNVRDYPDIPGTTTPYDVWEAVRKMERGEVDAWTMVMPSIPTFTTPWISPDLAKLILPAAKVINSLEPGCKYNYIVGDVRSFPYPENTTDEAFLAEMDMRDCAGLIPEPRPPCSSASANTQYQKCAANAWTAAHPKKPDIDWYNPLDVAAAFDPTSQRGRASLAYYMNDIPILPDVILAAGNLLNCLDRIDGGLSVKEKGKKIFSCFVNFVLEALSAVVSSRIFRIANAISTGDIPTAIMLSMQTIIENIGAMNDTIKASLVGILDKRDFFKLLIAGGPDVVKSIEFWRQLGGVMSSISVTYCQAVGKLMTAHPRLFQCFFLRVAEGVDVALKDVANYLNENVLGPLWAAVSRIVSGDSGVITINIPGIDLDNLDVFKGMSDFLGMLVGGFQSVVGILGKIPLIGDLLAFPVELFKGLFASISVNINSIWEGLKTAKDKVGDVAIKAKELAAQAVTAAYDKGYAAAKAVLEADYRKMLADAATAAQNAAVAAAAAAQRAATAAAAASAQAARDAYAAGKSAAEQTAAAAAVTAKAIADAAAVAAKKTADAAQEAMRVLLEGKYLAEMGRLAEEGARKLAAATAQAAADAKLAAEAVAREAAEIARKMADAEIAKAIADALAKGWDEGKAAMLKLAAEVARLMDIGMRDAYAPGSPMQQAIADMHYGAEAATAEQIVRTPPPSAPKKSNTGILLLGAAAAAGLLLVTAAD